MGERCMSSVLAMLVGLSFSSHASSEEADRKCTFGRGVGYFRVGGERTHEGPPILDEDFLGNFIYNSSNNDRAYFSIGLGRSTDTVRGTVFAVNGAPLHDYVATRGARCSGGVVAVSVSGYYVVGACFHRTQWDTQAYVDSDHSLIVARYQTDEYGRFCSKASTTSIELTRYRPYINTIE